MNYPMALEFASDAIKKDIHFGCFAVQADFRNLQCLDPIVQEYAWAPAISRMNRENLPAFAELCRRKQDSACTSLLFVNDSFFKKRDFVLDAVSVDGLALEHVRKHENALNTQDGQLTPKFTDDWEIVARAVLDKNERGYRIMHDTSGLSVIGKKQVPCVIRVTSPVFYALFPEQEPWTEEEKSQLSGALHEVATSVCADKKLATFYKKNTETNENIKSLLSLGKKRAHKVLQTWRRMATVEECKEHQAVDKSFLELEKKLIYLCQNELQSMLRVRNYIEAKI